MRLKPLLVVREDLLKLAVFELPEGLLLLGLIGLILIGGRSRGSLVSGFRGLRRKVKQLAVSQRRAIA